MAISRQAPRLAIEPTRADAHLGVVSIVMAFFVPIVSVFIAKGALDRAKGQGAENVPAYWGFWISLAMLAFAVVVVAGTIVMNLIGMPL